MGIIGQGPTLGDRPPSRRDRRQLGMKYRPHAPRREGERRAQIIVLFAVALVALAVLGIGAYGYYQTSVKPKTAAVVSIGGRSFDMAYMERRVRYVVRQALTTDPTALVLRNAQVAAQTALNDVSNEELDRQGAPEFGISVSEDEIDGEIRLRLRIAETADTSVFAEAYRNDVKGSGLHPNEYREAVAARLLEEKLRQHFRDLIPATAEQVRLRDIRVQSVDLPKLQERLQAGEDFSLLAAELSLDTVTKGKGGEMDWQARGQQSPSVETAVFSLEVGQVSQPVYQYGTYYLYQMLEKAADKEVTSDQRVQMEDQALINWRTTVSQQVQVVTYLNQQQFNLLVAIAKSEGSEASSGQ